MREKIIYTSVQIEGELCGMRGCVGASIAEKIMLREKKKTNPIETCMEQKNVLKCRRNAYGISNNPQRLHSFHIFQYRFFFLPQNGEGMPSNYTSLYLRYPC